MRSTRMSLGDLWVVPALLLAATFLWMLHAQAWDLGGRSPILNYDTAQYALAARELAWHHHLATPFALPIDLVRQSQPPWPLAAVQPGMVLAEALVLKLVPAQGATAGSDPRAWLTLILPFCCFLMIAGSFALSMRHLFARWWPEAPPWGWRVTGFLLGMMFVLDPEAQHFAVGGFTELPFVLGLVFAFLGLALEMPSHTPLIFGLALGLTGLFRANMLWLAPVFAVAGAWAAPRPRMVRTFVLVMLGYVLMALPWWFYKYRAFGDPGWDLTKFVLWDGVGGRTWFSLYHVTEMPQLPHGMEALHLLGAKALKNAPTLLMDMLLGPRGLWIGGALLYLVTLKPARPLAAAVIVALIAATLGVATSALSIPWLRYLFPTRIMLEPIGALALATLLWRMPAAALTPRSRAGLIGALALLALLWGGWSSVRGIAEARAASFDRGTPASTTLTALSIALNERLTAGELVMSNLGPALAWQTNHPVLHLALSPRDVDACRRRIDFRHIVLAFRDSQHAWAPWSEIVTTAGAAHTVPDLHVAAEHRFHTVDGFTIVWLELAPLPPTLAARPAAQAGSQPAAFAAR